MVVRRAGVQVWSCGHGCARALGSGTRFAAVGAFVYMIHCVWSNCVFKLVFGRVVISALEYISKHKGYPGIVRD